MSPFPPSTLLGGIVIGVAFTFTFTFTLAPVRAESPQERLSGAGLKRSGDAFLLADHERRVAEHDRLLAAAGSLRVGYWVRNEKVVTGRAYVSGLDRNLRSREAEIHSLNEQTFKDIIGTVDEEEDVYDAKGNKTTKKTSRTKVIESAGEQASKRDRKVARLRSEQVAIQQEKVATEGALVVLSEQMQAILHANQGLLAEYQRLVSASRERYTELGSRPDLMEALAALGREEAKALVLGPEKAFQDYAFSLCPTSTAQLQEKGLAFDRQRIVTFREQEVVSLAFTVRKLQEKVDERERARKRANGAPKPSSKYDELAARQRQLGDSLVRAGKAESFKIMAELNLVTRQIKQLKAEGIAPGRDEAENEKVVRETARQIAAERRAIAEKVVLLRNLADESEAFRMSLVDDLELKATIEALNKFRKHEGGAPLKIVVPFDYTQALKDLLVFEKTVAAAPAEPVPPDEPPLAPGGPHGNGVVRAGEDVKPKAEDTERELSGWGVTVDPDHDCRFNLEPEGGVGRLTLVLPGTPHQLLGPGRLMNAPRVLNHAAQAFGSVRVIVRSLNDADTGALPPSQPGYGAGLLLWLDEKNYARLHVAPSTDPAKASNHVFLEVRSAGRVVVARRSAPLPQGPTQLRLAMFFGKVEGSFCHDGNTWVPFPGFPMKQSPGLGAGVFAYNLNDTSLKAELTDFELVTFKPKANPPAFP